MACNHTTGKAEVEGSSVWGKIVLHNKAVLDTKWDATETNMHTNGSVDIQWIPLVMTHCWLKCNLESFAVPRNSFCQCQIPNEISLLHNHVVIWCVFLNLFLVILSCVKNIFFCISFFKWLNFSSFLSFTWNIIF